MFICPKCKSELNLPTCRNCGFTAQKENNVWQLSDMPDKVTSGNGDKYIGYEHIGESYSGNRKYLIEEKDRLFASEIARLTGDGVFLDLACGDGCFTIPCASYGTKIIAGDISNKMLTILQQRAFMNKISLESTILCRINALDIPLADASVDVVVANSVLHLISNPEKVITEIYRVLKRGGVFICQDDIPGNQTTSAFDNSRYNEIVNRLYEEYWNILSAYGITPKKFSWKFDRDGKCNSLFERKTTKTIEGGKTYKTSLKDAFLPRFLGRGFSDQVEVPQAIHDEAIERLLHLFAQRYGDDFPDICFKGTEGHLLVTVYWK